MNMETGLQIVTIEDFVFVRKSLTQVSLKL